MDLRILGPLEVRNGERVVPITGARRAVLALLLLNRNEVVSTERLIEELWGEDPPGTAPKMVQNAVSQLRKALGEGRASLRTHGSGYELQVDADAVDAARFEALAAEGRRALAAGDAAAAAERLREALALWRGPALADFAYESFAQNEIGRLDELRLTALEDRIDAELALGRGDLVGELEALVAEHPLRERLQGQLMLALYRAGRQADALAAFARTRALLRDELGLEPGPALRRLEKGILTHDPELQAPVTAPPAAAAATPPVRAARKTVAVLFLELVPCGAQLDPEAQRRVLGLAEAAASDAVERHGAEIQRLPNGTLMAVFGIPVSHEDDALRALRAAVELREALASLRARLERDWGVRVAARAGIEAGEVVTAADASGRPLVEGDAVAAAARLQAQAELDAIVAGPGAAALAGASATLARVDGAWHVQHVAPGAPAIPRRLDAPLVGRARELDLLRTAFARTRDERGAALFTVLGPAGIGKSKLAHEFGSAVGGEAQVLTGRCLPYGEGVTFWPLSEIVQQAFGRDARAAVASFVAGDPDGRLVADIVAGAIGAVDESRSVDETLWAVRKLFEALARERPLVLVLEDLHWAEATFLDLVQHVFEWARGAPILLLGLARPELLELRPSWAGGRSNVGSTLLEPLSEPESELLIENLLRGGELGGGARARITEAAEGNPLYLEQMVAIVSEEEAPGETLRIPPTIQALLAARLDRLDVGERALLERASIVGRGFGHAAIEHLTPAPDRHTVGAHLRALVGKELIRPERTPLAGEGFRFHHLLVREAAYDTLTKEARAELHERYADWLEQPERARATELEEIVGYHLEQAYRYRLELGPEDARSRGLADRAATRLAASGRRAYMRGDVPAAVGLLSRAAALREADAPERLELLADLGEALRETGDYERAEAAIAEALERADAIGDRRLSAYAAITQLRMRLQTDSELRIDELTREAERAVAVFDEFGDERRLAKAWELLAWGPWFGCHAAAASAALERAIEHAQRAGDARTEAQSVNLRIGAAFFGPMPVVEAIAFCEQILARPAEQRRVTASALRALAGLRAMQGEFAEARRLVARHRAMLEDLGLRVTAASAAETYGIVELLAADPVAAERELRWGYDSLEQMGVASTRSTLAALIAESLYEQGRVDEALRFSDISEQATTSDDVSALVQRGVRAKILAHLGQAAEAEEIARDAVARADATDFLVVRANAWMDLAEVLRLAGRLAEAAAPAGEALRLYEQKGTTVSAARARAFLQELGGS